VAAGVFAPGHLGELTRVVPFEMVDEVLAEAGAVQSRVRLLPARVVVYLLLAGALFTGVGYQRVWDKLVAGLGGLGLARPSGAALWQARARLGVAPLRGLFDLLRGPVTAVRANVVRWRGLLVTAIDGTQLSVPDTPINRARLGKHRGTTGADERERWAGYPSIRLLALVACGPRTILDAVFGPASGPGTGETSYAAGLLRSLKRGMVLLADRRFDTGALLKAFHATGAQFVVRLCAHRKPPILDRYRDGSYLSIIGGVQVRIIEATITVSTPRGTRTGTYRLATTLTDHRTYPAREIITLYHQRWEIETLYLELKSTMLGGAVLRSEHPAAIDQEIYALLTTYQILRIAITDATDSVTGTDPDRASFTIALETARDLITQAANIIAGTTIDLVGTIGRRVLDQLLPPRRPHFSPRIVKRPLSTYTHTAKKPSITASTYHHTLDITIHTKPLTTTPQPQTS